MLDQRSEIILESIPFIIACWIPIVLIFIPYYLVFTFENDIKKMNLYNKTKSFLFFLFCFLSFYYFAIFLGKFLYFFFFVYHFPRFSDGFNYFKIYHQAYFAMLQDYVFDAKGVLFFTVSIFLYMYFWKESFEFLFYGRKTNKKLEKYYFCLITSICFLSLFFYGFLKILNLILESKKIGVFRNLIDGNEVIRSILTSEKRLRIEILNRKYYGFRFYKELKIDKNAEVLNTLVVGAMGSGKTVFLAPICLQFYENKYPSLIIDNKGDFCQLLAGKEGVVVLSPFDARSPFWSIAEDIETELDAIEFVSQLIPVYGGSNDVFSLAARDISLGAIKYLQNTKPHAWSIGEVLETISRDDILSIFKEHHIGGLQTLKDCQEVDGKIVVGETSAGIFLNLRACLKNFEILSMAWPKNLENKKLFSIKKWMRGNAPETIFVILSFKQLYMELSGFFGGIIIDTFLKSALNLEDSKERRMGLFLDELGAVPRINTLANGVKLLRSKGVCVFAGIQEVGVIRKKYEQDGGTEVLLNGFSTKLIGRAETPEYAEYFVRLFGKNKYKKITRTESIDTKGRRNISSSQEEVVEDAINSGELLTIPAASIENGAIFYLKMSQIPIVFKLAFPIVILERPYPGNIDAEWLKYNLPVQDKIDSFTKNKTNETNLINPFYDDNFEDKNKLKNIDAFENLEQKEEYLETETKENIVIEKENKINEEKVETKQDIIENFDDLLF